MMINDMNESLEKFEALEEKKESRKDKLAKVFDAILFGLKRRGENRTKAYEIALQNAIEKVYPEKNWWEVTNVNIFTDLLETRDPEKTAKNIVDSIKDKEEEIAESISQEDALKLAKEMQKEFPEAEHIVYGMRVGDDKATFFHPTMVNDEDLMKMQAGGFVYALHNKKPFKESVDAETVEGVAEMWHKEYPKMSYGELARFIQNKYDIYTPTYTKEDIETIYEVCAQVVNEKRYTVLDKKIVSDMDGFDTEYTLYRDNVNGSYVTVFGDSDEYRPEDENFDAEFDSEEQAREWFDNYKGYEDEDTEDRMWFDDEFDENLTEAKQVSREYIAEGDYEGHHYTVIATKSDTQTYRWEDIDIEEDYADVVGSGRYKWMNRPWQRFTFAEAMKKALVSWFGKQAADKAEEAVETSNTIQEAFDKFMKLIEWKKNGEAKNESVEETMNEAQYAPASERAKVKAFVPGDHVKMVANNWWTNSANDDIGRTGIIMSPGTWRGNQHVFHIKADDHRVDKCGYDDTTFLASADELEMVFDESLNEEKENVFVYCPECGKRNRVRVEFKAFNKPFEDTEHKCEFCGAEFGVHDDHEYNDDGTIIEDIDNEQPDFEIIYQEADDEEAEPFGQEYKIGVDKKEVIDRYGQKAYDFYTRGVTKEDCEKGLPGMLLGMVETIASEKFRKEHPHMLHTATASKLVNKDIFPSGIDQLRKKLGKILLPH